MKRTQPETSSSEEPKKQEDSGVSQPPGATDPQKKVKLTEGNEKNLAPNGGTEKTTDAGLQDDKDVNPFDEDEGQGDDGEGGDDEIGLGRRTDIQEEERRYLQTLTTENCLLYWRWGVQRGMPLLSASCRQMTSNEFYDVSSSDDLVDLPESIMSVILHDDSIDVQFECDVTEALIRWIDWDEDRASRSLRLFQLLRWVGLDAAFIRRRLLAHPRLSAVPCVFRYFQRVVNYLSGGSPFANLVTIHRPTTGLERCIFIIGIDKVTSVTSEVIRISLQRSEASVRGTIPTEVKREAAACICPMTNTLFVSGIGNGFNEIWQWTGVGGWNRCGRMTIGRRRHCMVFANESSLFLIAGFASVGPLTSVEKFDIRNEISIEVGQLRHAVSSAACIINENILYVFGGADKDRVPVSYLQAYNTMRNTCYTLEPAMPQPAKMLRAVLWDRLVVIICRETCICYDLDNGQWSHRPQFGSGRIYFGCVIENQKLYVFGGGNNVRDPATGVFGWILSDQIRYVPMADVVEDKPAQWRGVSNFSLPVPSLVHSYGTLNVPTGGRRRVW